MDTQEYISHVNHILNSLAQLHAQGGEIDAIICTAGLEPGRVENKKVRDFAVKVLKINARDFDRALRIALIIAEFGKVPATASEFVKLFAASKGITAKYNGVLKMNEIPYLPRDDGGKDMIPPHLWDQDDFKILIATKFHRVIPFGELQQLIRVKAGELYLDFASQINDAAEVWYGDVCRDRLWQINGDIGYADNTVIRQRGQDSLRRLAKSCFVCHTEQDVEFVVAVFNKFIWQVKRKIAGMPIFDHLMGVLLGDQGNGKSTLVSSLLTPVAELRIHTDFGQITDEKIISIWRSYIGVLDEMQGARKSDMEAVKHAITAETMGRRTMRTNVTQEVAQNLTFIGCANVSDLSELIRDPTGTRRFVGLKTKVVMDWDVVNGIDWKEVWQSVDEASADPLKPHKAMLQASQAEDRTITPFEDWIESLGPKSFVTDAKNEMVSLDRQAILSATDLYGAFVVHEETRFAAIHKSAAMDIRVFGRKMKAHCLSSNARFRTEAASPGSAKAAYIWIG